MSTLQTYHFKLDFQNLDQNTGGKWLIHGTKLHKDNVLQIITWLLCFFLGFDTFIPGFDRFIPRFDRFIPASIPVTRTPLQSKCTLVNKICIVMYLEIIFIKFYFK